MENSQTGTAVDVQPGTDQGYIETPLQDPANIEDTSVQANGSEANGDDQFGSQSLPPELEETRKQLMRDYHAKTQKLAEERGRYTSENESLRNKADTLDKLLAQDWFKKASREAYSQLNGGGGFEISDEEYEAAKNDKNAFKSMVMRMSQQMVNSQVAPAIGAQNEALQDIQVNRELDQALSSHPEIQELIDNEDPGFYGYLDAGYDYVTAYQKYVFDNPSRGTPVETEPSREEVINQSRAGSVARSGMSQVRGERVIKARNLDEAFDQAFAAFSRGEKDFRIEKP